MAKDKTEVEAVLLKKSELGNCGELVKLSEEDAKLYEANGFIDTNKDAVKHAKSI